MRASDRQMLQIWKVHRVNLGRTGLRFEFMQACEVHDLERRARLAHCRREFVDGLVREFLQERTISHPQMCEPRTLRANLKKLVDRNEAFAQGNEIQPAIRVGNERT
mmetsp:Transcript_21036/g.72662  ORF Transcript_21036/g.72662 Transcript_21036/m.72662 type:complete len:107 (+) Transcript_21036:1391-1711(+)